MLLLCAWSLVLFGQPVPADQEAGLFVGERTGPLRYEVTVDGAISQGETTATVHARFAAECRTFSADPDGVVPLLLTLGAGEGSCETATTKAPLRWGYEGRSVLLLMSRDSLIHEVPVALPQPCEPPSMDPFASYLAAAWWIPLPAGPLEVGASFLRDVEGEPGLTGEALVDRRVVGQVERVETIDGRTVVFVTAEVEERMRDDHPRYTGKGLCSMRVARDGLTGELLGARIVESSEVTARTGEGAGMPVRTEGLEARVRLVDGPELTL